MRGERPGAPRAGPTGAPAGTRAAACDELPHGRERLGPGRGCEAFLRQRALKEQGIHEARHDGVSAGKVEGEACLFLDEGGALASRVEHRLYLYGISEGNHLAPYDADRES